MTRFDIQNEASVFLENALIGRQVLIRVEVSLRLAPPVSIDLVQKELAEVKLWIWRDSELIRRNMCRPLTGRRPVTRDLHRYEGREIVRRRGDVSLPSSDETAGGTPSRLSEISPSMLVAFSAVSVALVLHKLLRPT